MDRAFKGPVLVASPQGGMDIETVAHDTPHLIFKVCRVINFQMKSDLLKNPKEAIDIQTGIKPEQTRRLAQKLGFTSEEKIADVSKHL